MDNLLGLLNGISPLSADLRNHLVRTLKRKEIAKKELLLVQSHVCKNIYFVDTGLFRCYYISQEGKEICSWFMRKGDVVISVESFFKQIPSYENIQALEDSVVYYVSYSELLEIYKLFPEFNAIARVLTEHYYCLSEQRLFLLHCSKAKDRYKMLFENYPELITSVSSTHLASFLGITLETLSRLKSERK